MIASQLHDFSRFHDDDEDRNSNNETPEEDDDFGLGPDDDWAAVFNDDKGYRPRETIAPIGNVDDMDESEMLGEGTHDFEKSEEEKTFLKKAIENVILFKGCEDNELLEVIEYMHKIQVAPGTVVIKQGDEGDAFYVVKDGTYECTVQQEDGKVIKICTYKEGGTFGELALIHNKPRAATVITETSGHLYVMNAIRYVWLKRQQAMRNHERFRKMLDSIPLFSKLDNDSKSRLEDSIEVETYNEGTFVCKYGDEGDAMYFLINGAVDVFVADGENEVWLKLMGANEFFGERSLITGEPRAATVKCREKCQIAILSKDSFERLITDNVILEMKKFLDIYDMEKTRACNLSGAEKYDDNPDTESSEICIAVGLTSLSRYDINP